MSDQGEPKKPDQPPQMQVRPEDLMRMQLRLLIGTHIKGLIAAFQNIPPEILLALTTEVFATQLFGVMGGDIPSLVAIRAKLIDVFTEAANKVDFEAMNARLMEANAAKERAKQQQSPQSGQGNGVDTTVIKMKQIEPPQQNKSN